VNATRGAAAGEGAGGSTGERTADLLPLTFRPVVTRALLLCLGIALVAVLTTVAVLMPHDGAAPWTTGDRITVVITGLVFCAVLVLLSRPKAVAGPDGLTVINLTVKRRLAWAEVVGVNLRPGDAWVHLDLADGTTLAVMGIQPGIARQQALRDARRLRDLVQELGEARGTEATGPR